MGDSIIRHYNGPAASGTPTLPYYRPVYWSGSVSNPPANTSANGTRLTQGYIAIQAESHPYRFRRIELLDLEGCMDRGSPAYRSHFVKSKASACTVPTDLSAKTFPKDFSLERSAGGYSLRSGQGGILEVTTLKGVLLYREVLPGPSRVEIPPRRSGLVLVKWKSGRETWVFPAVGL